ncbi:MAG TPA: MarP family serine protease [Gaiellaceae bacterium]|nr:MarP family serine protease [Gaiellaceae bacterium]
MKPNVVDWAALVIVLLTALGGMRRGLVVTALSLGGLLLGGWAGSRVAPHLLHGGSGSAWTPLAGLVGAVFGAIVLQALAGIAGSFVRGGLRLTPLRLIDSFGGLLLGAVSGLVLVWALSATLLLAPGQSSLRRDVQRSEVVRRLDQAVPPRRLLKLIARIDPFPSIAGPTPPSSPPPENVSVPGADDVVRVLGTACGVGVEGSGWFATHDLVVTAAHVVAGEHDTGIEIPGAEGVHPVTVVAFDAHNDVAVLRFDGSHAALPLVDPQPGAAVAIVGYPEDGPLRKTPSRIGRTAVFLTQDAYGNGPVPRTITAVGGDIRHGDSGAPAIDANGAVQSTIFAARLGASGGYGVPASVVRRALDSAGSASVSTGACASG